MSDFRKNLKKYRRQREMTQNELGTILGCGYTAVVRYENGEVEPGSDDLTKIANALAVSVEELCGKENSP